jgi:hypothetical protein
MYDAGGESVDIQKSKEDDKSRKSERMMKARDYQQGDQMSL